MATVHPELLERPRPHPFNMLEAKVARLEARIVELEKQAAQAAEFRYCGVWGPGTEYKIGNFVTDAGALWHCQKPTRSRPGCGDGSWRLCVKSGAFAK